MSVNQNDNTLVERKRQIPELPKEYGFLDEKVQTLKSSRSNYIVEITCNINKISKYLNSKSVERDKIYLCIEKLDKCIQKFKAVSYELQNYVFEETTKKEISDIYIDQRLQIIEIKKYIEVHNPIPYLTKNSKKKSVSSISIFSESKDSKSNCSNNSGNSIPLKTKYFTKGSNQPDISCISSELSNNRILFSSCKTAENYRRN